MSPSPMHNPFQVLEIILASAEDLAPVSKSMKTYAVVWINVDRKLSTKVDIRGGHTNPKWNDKFVFRVDEKFLTSEPSVLSIDIYAAAWLKDILIGSVRVPISHLFNSPKPTSESSWPSPSNMRFTAFQIRRPSGRPQGVINIGVQLLNGATRSMPLYSELSASVIGASVVSEKGALRRTQSDHTDLSMADDQRENIVGDKGSLVSSDFRRKDQEGFQNFDGEGSAVNGSLCSDVGPSASVVAAAIAQGLIRTQHGNNGTGESSIVGYYEEENDSVEGLRTKLERWKAEVPMAHENEKMGKHYKHRVRRRKGGDDQKLFSCFGNVFGCQISITCGGGNSNNRRTHKRGMGRRRVHRISSPEN